MNAALLSVVLVVSPAAQSDRTQTNGAFPTYDVKASCSTAPNKKACKNLEESAAARLAPIWPSLPTAKRVQCAAAGAAVPGGSYVAAESCATQGQQR